MVSNEDLWLFVAVADFASAAVCSLWHLFHQFLVSAGAYTYQFAFVPIISGSSEALA